MHERDGKRNGYLSVPIAATRLGVSVKANLGSNPKILVRLSHLPVSGWDDLSQVDETTGGRIGQTCVTLNSTSASSATYCLPSIKVQKVRFSTCSLTEAAPLSIALQPK